MRFGNDFAPVPSGIDLGELSAKEADQGRVINPDEEHREGTPGPEGAARRRLPEVNPDEVFPSYKQKRRDRRAYPDIAPVNDGIGQILVNRGYQHRDIERVMNSVAFSIHRPFAV